MKSMQSILYVDWLHALVESARPGQTFYLLFNQLYRMTFTADKIVRDWNRAETAIILRENFYAETNIVPVSSADSRNVSVLEVLLALANDMSKQVSVDYNTPKYFFEMLSNIKLDIPDSEYLPKDETDVYVHNQITKLLKRKYSRKGFLFPLKNPTEDQRSVELWFQMQKYLIEKEDDSWIF